MKRKQHKNLLLVSFSLILSLVSLTSNTNSTSTEAIKTAFVVIEKSKDKRFSIPYHKANSIELCALIKYATFIFKALKKDYDIKGNTALASYTNKTLGLKAALLQTKFYKHSIYKTLYNASTS